MELDPVHEIAEAEGLLLVRRGAGEVPRVGRKLVRVAVHVEDGERRLEDTEHQVVPSVVRQRDRGPTDLAPLARVDACPEHLRDQLRTEADAEDRTSSGERALYEPGLGGEEGMAGAVVHRHRAAEHDEPAHAPEIARRRVAPGKIEIAMMDPSLAEDVRE